MCIRRKVYLLSVASRKAEVVANPIYKTIYTLVRRSSWCEKEYAMHFEDKITSVWERINSSFRVIHS